MYTLIEIALSVGVLVTLVTALSICVCGCKNSNQKSELVGTAGVVKIRFDEEAPSPTPTTPASIKRASTQNSQRSLPEIPHPVGRPDSGDTASEIYATVNLDEGNKTVATASTSRDYPYEHAYAKVQNESHNILVEVTDETSEREIIQIDEREVGQNPAESVVISASVAISGQLPSSQELPYITPPSPRPNTDNTTHFSGDSTDSAKGYTSISVREPLSNIRAQSSKPPTQPHYATVSDDSDEMYAAIEEASVGEGSDTYAQIATEPRRRDPTPDLLHSDPTHASRRSAPPDVGASTSNATHSRQASSSSCSNSTGALGSPKPEKRQANSPLPPPPHATAHAASHASSHANTHVSSHATSHVTSHVTVHASAHSSSHNMAHGTSHATAHPSAHANSHAPPRQPAIEHALAQRHQRMSSTGDLHFNHDKRRSLNEKHQRNNSCVNSSDFYGCNYPIEKHRFSSGDLIRPLVARDIDIDQRDSQTDNLYNSIDGPGYSDYSSADANTSLTSDHRVHESPSRNLEEMYAKVSKKPKARTEDPMRRSKEFTGADGEPHTSKYRSDDPGYETIDRKKSMNHGYETIAHKERKSSQNQDPGYETVKDINKAGPNSNFSNNNLLKLNHLVVDSGPNSIVSSDAGYEHISKTDNNASDSDPNYEVLRNQPPTPPYATIAPNYKVQPTYSTVNKKPSKYNNWPANNNEEPTLEPNYESMPHDPLYNTGSESDPNYESVRPKDPNYESVSTQDPNYESLRCKDPKYESVRSKNSKNDYDDISTIRSKKDPNYESIKYFELSKKEPPYEKVHNEASGSSGVERSDSAAGYEKINVPNRSEAKSSINNGGDATVSDYFQV
ncbi:hypothetical protein PYW08_015907 [Mythimna loreyi]|uniref:Uncharacterized protein n=1 Tax=Mythimna loreyi TaxID=667449 RepID=A0ACC2QS03_9NEOP|nr:hypothetical protein PYW08_015907 [Mythimna loreyi]